MIGHRGVRGPLPENCMAAFERAMADGADGVELDVRPCASGELVVAHDDDLERVTAGRDRRRVDALSSDELRAIDLGGGEGVPTLVEVLRWAEQRGALVNVELKGDVRDVAGAAREAARVLGASGWARAWVIVSSFERAMLEVFHASAPGIATGVLFATNEAEVGWSQVGATGACAVHPRHGLVTQGDVQRARDEGRAVNVWTVNDEARAIELASFGVDAIITDRPGPIGEALRRARGPA